MTTDRSITRSELHGLVWAEPLTRLAARLGVSDVGLRKICQRHDIPLPPQGHWQRRAVGRSLSPTPLPDADRNPVIEFPARPQPAPFSADLMDRVFAPLIEVESRPDMRIRVSSDAPAHPLARRILKSLSGKSPDKYGAVVHDAGPFRVRVPPASVARATRLIDALAQAFDARGLEMQEGDPSDERTGILVAGETERLTIEEPSQRHVHRSTEAEKAHTRRYGYSTAPLYDFLPSGVMTIGISTATYRDGVRSLWKDSRKRKVEDVLNEVMAGLYHSAHFAAVQRHRTEVRQQRAEEENVRRAALRQERQAALKELEDLEARSEAWNRAQRLRAFIAACEASIRGQGGARGSETADWVERALRHADRIDPLTPTPASALDYEEADLRPVSAWQIPAED